MDYVEKDALVFHQRLKDQFLVVWTILMDKFGNFIHNGVISNHKKKYDLGPPIPSIQELRCLNR